MLTRIVLALAMAGLVVFGAASAAGGAAENNPNDFKLQNASTTTSGEFFGARGFRNHAASSGNYKELLGERPLFKDGEIIVKYRRSATPVEINRIRSRVSDVEVLPLKGIEVQKLRSGESVAEGVRRAERTDGIEWAEPNWLRYPLLKPDDSRYSEQWGHSNDGSDVVIAPTDQMPATVTMEAKSGNDIGSEAAWNTTTGSATSIIAVLDSGITFEHPDLADNIYYNEGELGDGREANGKDDDGNGYRDDWRGWDFCGVLNSRFECKGDNDPHDIAATTFHGTHVAGIAAAKGDNGYGVAGVSWNSKIVPVKIFGSTSSVETADLLRAFRYAEKRGAKVVNGSFGGGGYSKAEFEALRSMNDVLFVFAAGNSGVNMDQATDEYAIDYPASYSKSLNNVMSVASSTPSGSMSSFSNSGKTRTDIAAPGSAIISTWHQTETWFKDLSMNDVFSDWTPAGTGDLWDWQQYIGLSPAPLQLEKTNCSTTETENLSITSCDINIVMKYAANADTYISTQEPIDLTGVTECRVAVAADWKFGDEGDYMALEASHDNVNWHRLKKFTSKNYVQGIHDKNENGFPDLYEYSLKKFAGAKVYLRYRLVTNANDNEGSASIYATAIDGCKGAGSISWTHLDGTSMASPYVAGAASLMYSLYPDASPAWVRHVINGGARKSRVWRDRVRSGGHLNLPGAFAAAESATTPVAFNVINPTRKIAITERARTITWNASGSKSGIKSYDVILDGKKVATTNSKTTEYRVSKRLRLGNHTVKITATTNDGQTTSTPLVKFTRKLVPVPTVTQVKKTNGALKRKKCGKSDRRPCTLKRNTALLVRGRLGLPRGAKPPKRVALEIQGFDQGLLENTMSTQNGDPIENMLSDTWYAIDRKLARTNGRRPVTFKVKDLQPGMYRARLIVGQTRKTIQATSTWSYFEVKKKGKKKT